MKVLLLLQGHSCLETVKGYFTGVNARPEVCDPDILPAEIVERKPELVVVSEEHGTSSLLFRLRNIATIVVTDRGKPGTSAAVPEQSKVATVTWPVARDGFLRLSAEMARLSQRRLFSAVVRIFSAGGESTCIGRSIDFSASGMAFRAGELFTVGDLLDISLSLPAEQESMKLPVEVMRIAGEGAESTYGVRFTRLDRRTENRLREFIGGA